MGRDEQMKESILREIQKRGMRITKQRSMILDVILEKKWTDCKEIYYEAVRRDPNVGLSTVYRTIRALEGIGFLKRGRQYAFNEALLTKFPNK